MKKISYGLILTLVCLSIQAAPHPCKQTNGKYLYSDKPCTNQSETPKDTLMTTSSGRIVKLSTTPDPLPLPNELVNSLFSNIERACLDKDGETLLAQFSTTIQHDYLENKPEHTALFDVLANTCGLITNINNEIKKSTEPLLYASKMPSKDILLCFYTADKGLENCRGNIKITNEHNQLKLNMRY